MKYNTLFLILLILLFVFCGCSNNIEINESKEYDESPPYIVHFLSLKEYFDFVSTTLLPEAEVEAYLVDNYYYTDNITSKEDVINIQNIMESLPLPQIENYQLVEIMIYPEEYFVNLFYQTVDGEKINFSVNYGSNISEIMNRCASSSEYQLSSIDSKNINTLYFRKSSDERICVFDAFVDNKHMDITTFNTTKEETLAIINNLSFTKIQNLK